jgi:hypothetical protein
MIYIYHANSVTLFTLKLTSINPPVSVYWSCGRGREVLQESLCFWWTSSATNDAPKGPKTHHSVSNVTYTSQARFLSRHSTVILQSKHTTVTNKLIITSIWLFWFLQKVLTLVCSATIYVLQSSYLSDDISQMQAFSSILFAVPFPIYQWSLSWAS